MRESMRIGRPAPMGSRSTPSPPPPIWWRCVRISSPAATWCASRSTASPAGWGSTTILPARLLSGMLRRGSTSSDHGARSWRLIMDIEINIDHLRLEGVEHMNQEELAALVQDELARLVDTYGMPEVLRRGGAVEIGNRTIRVTAGATRRQIGREIAH